MEHPFFHSAAGRGRCCQLCYYRIFAFFHQLFFIHKDTHTYLHTHTQIDSLIFCSGGGAMTFDTWVSLSAQISHRQCIWAAEVDLCSRSMMWLFHWPLSQWPLPAENHAVQTYLCLHNNMFCFGLCGPRMISVNITNDGWNTNIFEYNSSSNTAISAYLQIRSLKLRCNQLAGNNT